MVQQTMDGSMKYHKMTRLGRVVGSFGRSYRACWLGIDQFDDDFYGTPTKSPMPMGGSDSPKFTDINLISYIQDRLPWEKVSQQEAAFEPKTKDRLRGKARSAWRQIKKWFSRAKPSGAIIYLPETSGSIWYVNTPDTTPVRENEGDVFTDLPGDGSVKLDVLSSRDVGLVKNIDVVSENSSVYSVGGQFDEKNGVRSSIMDHTALEVARRDNKLPINVNHSPVKVLVNNWME